MLLRQADGKATVVYLFPRSVEITKKAGRLLVVAQIGRLHRNLVCTNVPK